MRVNVPITVSKAAMEQACRTFGLRNGVQVQQEWESCTHLVEVFERSVQSKLEDIRGSAQKQQALADQSRTQATLEVQQAIQALEETQKQGRAANDSLAHLWRFREAEGFHMNTRKSRKQRRAARRSRLRITFQLACMQIAEQGPSQIEGLCLCAERPSACLKILLALECPWQQACKKGGLVQQLEALQFSEPGIERVQFPQLSRRTARAVKRRRPGDRGPFKYPEPKLVQRDLDIRVQPHHGANYTTCILTVWSAAWASKALSTIANCAVPIDKQEVAVDVGVAEWLLKKDRSFAGRTVRPVPTVRKDLWPSISGLASAHARALNIGARDGSCVFLPLSNQGFTDSSGFRAELQAVENVVKSLVALQVPGYIDFEDVVLYRCIMPAVETRYNVIFSMDWKRSTSSDELHLDFLGASREGWSRGNRW